MARRLSVSDRQVKLLIRAVEAWLGSLPLTPGPDRGELEDLRDKLRNGPSNNTRPRTKDTPNTKLQRQLERDMQRRGLL